MTQLFTIEVSKTNKPKSGYRQLAAVTRAANALSLWQGWKPSAGYRGRLKRNGKVIGRKVS